MKVCKLPSASAIDSDSKIPPYSTLIFKVELVSVEDAHKGHNHPPGQHGH